jgi:hypothetical protein
MGILLPSTYISAQTSSPTASPTFSTSQPSLAKSADPTLMVSANPSPSPTSSPTETVDKLSFIEKALTMILTGVGPLDDDDKAHFARRTEQYIEFYYNDDDQGDSAFASKIEKVSVDISNVITEVLTEKDGSRRLGDNTQRELDSESELKVQFDQEMAYVINTDDQDFINSVSPQLLIQDPFNTLGRREKYIIFLKTLPSEAEAFTNLHKLSPPELVGKDSQVSMMAIIGGSVGGVVLLTIGILAYCWRSRKKQKELREFSDYGPRDPGNRGMLPESVSSALQEPEQRGYFQSQNSIQGGYQGSVITNDDPDYGYGPNMDRSIVSGTDGTYGGTIQSGSRMGGASLMGASFFGGQTLGTNSVFDEQSFRNFRNGNVKEELIIVEAPAGKLGVVIDTPDNGAPILHRIKDTCPIADQLRVNDKLIAVDDEDVTNMTAVKVSKLISQKSGNAVRKFTILRSV